MDYECQQDHKPSASSAWLGIPLETATRNECALHCNTTLLCAQFLHNKYKACYMLRRVDSFDRDAPEHQTVTCRLRQKPQSVPMWEVMASLLEKPMVSSRSGASGIALATKHLGQRSYRSVLHASVAHHLPFDVFVLNLEASTERLRKMRLTLNAAGIGADVWRRVPGVYGTDLDIASLRSMGFVSTRQHVNNVACAWSHFIIWAAIAARAERFHGKLRFQPAFESDKSTAFTHSSNRSVLVLEDDAILHPDFVRKVVATLNRCERLHYDVCSLTWYRYLTPPHCREPLRRTERLYASGGPPLVRLGCQGGEMVSGTAAYLISPQGARHALEVGLPFHMEIDRQIGQTRRLRWFGLEREREVAAHDFSVRSVRAYGVSSSKRNLRMQRT